MAGGTTSSGPDDDACNRAFELSVDLSESVSTIVNDIDRSVVRTVLCEQLP
jgi:hypothetical protein